MNQTIPYRIIIIGGNHLNTLSVIRCLGECNCRIHVLIHADQALDDMVCANTRFSKGNSSVVSKTEDGIVQWLLSESESEKQILFPCSDFAAYVIDKNSEILKKYYLIPGFTDKPRMVCQLMSKWDQKKFADKYDIPMAKSWLIETNNQIVTLPEDIVYPCIIKPNKSAFGVKDDITICSNEEELQSAITVLKEQYPQELLLQEYIKKTSEFDCMGCILNNKDQSITNTINKIYDMGGNTVYAQFTENPLISKVNDIVISRLYEMGYRGMFDVEYILSEEKVYLIEINFRHCGVGFGAIKNKVYAPYLWCLDVCNEIKTNNYKQKVKNGRYLMDETVCFNHRKEFGISTSKWLSLCLKQCSMGKFDIRDLKGTSFLYKQIVKRN